MVIRLNAVEAKALFLNESAELLREVLVKFAGIELGGKSNHFFANDFVEAVGIYLSTCRVVCAISLFADKGCMGIRTMGAPSHVSTLQQPSSNTLQPHKQKGRRFLAVCTTCALIEADNGDAMELPERPHNVQGPNARHVHLFPPYGELRMFQKAAKPQSSHQRQHIQQKSEETISDQNLGPFTQRDARQATRFLG